MKIINIIGGLGNQMFQYAFALALQSHFSNEKILIDNNCFNGYPLHDGYLLDYIFKVSIPTANRSEILKLNYPLFHYRLWQIGRKLLPKLKSVYRETGDMVFDKNVFINNKSLYYDGYWQSELYFHSCLNQIKEAFRFPPLDSINGTFFRKLTRQETVSIHIRRGDYLSDPLFKGLTDIDYYEKAVKYILDKQHVDCFVIFSNDINWCKQNIPGLTHGKSCQYVDWNKGKDSFRDMQLMSLCNHNIVANSSFSWWGAWLNNNPDKIIISPQKWINKDSATDIIPSSWIKI